MQRISVDFPDPDGPHRTIFSPARTVKLMFVRALKSPYHFSTLSMIIMGGAGLLGVFCPLFMSGAFAGSLSLRRTARLQCYPASAEVIASSTFHRLSRVRH